jgi:hypothetical protein
LPASAHSAATAVAGYVQSPPHGDTQVMHNVEPIKYKATRFDQYFAPIGETPGSALGRHIVETVTKTESVRLPHGVHLQCSLLGCTHPPPPPSKKDGDERLSMAPTPLAKAPDPPKPPALEDCIALYRADKPLPYGCLVDTPNRAVDAELRARAAHGGIDDGGR